ncbi:MAG: asparaginase [Planctomycetes bacterium]|jgi:L-asparaginase|nr:asparaginase [Planctomycetota bacterium]
MDSADSAPLRILATGGTFDKAYLELEGRLHFSESHVPEMLRLGRSRLPVVVETLMLIDSLEMTEAHRGQVLEACRRAGEDRIVITHGTDTMELTARTVGAARLAKTIVLTGAMVPYTFGSSDGLFNLGSALAFAQALPLGTYVAMNGRAFRWDDVRKNKSTGVFEGLA